MTYSADWFSVHIPNWEKWLDKFTVAKYPMFLEIGCFEGKATTWLLDNFPLCGVVTIDMFGGGMEDGDKGEFFSKDAEKNYLENVLPYGSRIRTMKGASLNHLVYLNWKNEGNEVFDFIYIDGSHRSIEVLQDSVLAWGLLKEGGVMVWDDYTLDRYGDKKLNPGMAIDAFLAIYEGKYKLIEIDKQVCIEKL